MTIIESAVRQRLQEIRDMVKFRSKHAPEMIALRDSADLIEALLAERENPSMNLRRWQDDPLVEAADAALARFGEGK